MFCREAVHALRGRAAPEHAQRGRAAPDEVLFVAQGDEAEAEAFFSRAWPEARAICDPEKQLYGAFGLGRGTVGQLFGPAVWAAGFRALRRGARLGAPVGDPLLMSGAFVVRDGEIVWEHVYRHAGDHPDFDSALRTVRALRADASIVGNGSTAP